ncbi:TPA: hypothetical protein DCZ39_05275 [Patescibacteria group bacterium]|nr:hypothetical protein [Candidatus Gracilibacteria bacterium]
MEVIIAITSFFLLLTVIINIYTRMIKLKYNIQARTNVIQDAHFVIEKINLLFKDYTIDYEEYFNRKNVGCDTSNDNGHCNLFTAYGNNSNSNQVSSTVHEIYFCSSVIAESTPQRVIMNPDVQNG